MAQIKPSEGTNFLRVPRKEVGFCSKFIDTNRYNVNELLKSFTSINQYVCVPNVTVSPGDSITRDKVLQSHSVSCPVNLGPVCGWAFIWQSLQTCFLVPSENSISFLFSYNIPICLNVVKSILFQQIWTLTDAILSGEYFSYLSQVENVAF